MRARGPRRGRLLAAALLCWVVSLAGCTAAGEGLPGKPGDTRTRSVRVQPCTGTDAPMRHTPSESLDYRAQLQGPAEPPGCTDGRWRFVLPAVGNAPMKRRTELWLSEEKGYANGDDAVIDMRIRAYLGDAAFDASQWHVVWQLHGPTFGDWLGPALTLQVNNGQWVLAGGNGHAEHGSGGSNYMWHRPIARFSNGQTKRVRVEVHVTHNPDRARVDAWVDDTQVLRDYSPRSRQGLSPGTLYPGQEAVQGRIGLYRGTLPGGSAPTYEQIVEVWDPATR